MPGYPAQDTKDTAPTLVYQDEDYVQEPLTRVG
jgi:hypothetical protein